MKCNLCGGEAEVRYRLKEFSIVTCVRCGLVALDRRGQEGDGGSL